jgi:anhydro-N-acetylmuramic acid kinase
MANLTLLPKAAGSDEVMAFDTGPGNVVLDGLARVMTGGLLQHDTNGAMAARGRASEGLLSELLADPFFSQEPPRSTGRERFGERYARKVLELAGAMGLSSEDTMATAVELTAGSVATAVHQFLLPRGAVDAVIVSGGGVNHPGLMASLERRLKPARFSSLSAFGVPPEAKEALAFAFLAHLTLSGLPGNLPSATGARHPVVLGAITPGPNGARA